MKSPTIVQAGQVSSDGAEVELHDPSIAGDAWKTPSGSGYDPETDEEAVAQGPDAQWTFWERQIAASLTYEQRWRNEAVACETAVFGPDQDRGMRDGSSASMDTINDEVALIHSNIEVLKPLIYSETPQPIVRRRWRGDGRQDETDLMVAEAAQRIAVYLLDTEDFDGAMKATRDDWLIAGRGQTRVVYKAASRKSLERVCPRTVPWPRLLLAVGTEWHALPWIAIEIPMTRHKIGQRWPHLVDQVSFNTPGLVDKSLAPGDDERRNASRNNGLSVQKDESGQPAASPFDTAMVWEIWNREQNQIVWWTAGCKQVLEVSEDFLGLEDFWPCPKPLIATTRSESLVPRPDIRYYQRRAKEIDKATKKLESLLDVISVSALIPAAMTDDIKKLLNGTNQIIPVQDWIALMERGGMNGVVQWLPIQAIMAAAQALITIREQNRQAMFDASGVSDIMRAQSDPNETATAQQIKGRYAGLRLSDRQRTMALHARDTLRLMIEIAVEHFDTTTIAEICGLDLPMTEMERSMMIQQAQAMQAAYDQQMQLYGMAVQAAEGGAQIDPGPEPQKPDIPDPPKTSWELVHAKLRSDITRKITISIETQSTVLADEQADKEARIEFISAFATFVQNLMPLVATGQFDVKTVKEILLFGVRGFPKARTLESLIASLPDEIDQPGDDEDTQITVAKIRAETDKMLKQMDNEQREADRQTEIKMKGVDLIAKSADIATRESTAPSLPPEPRPAPKPVKGG